MQQKLTFCVNNSLLTYYFYSIIITKGHNLKYVTSDTEIYFEYKCNYIYYFNFACNFVNQKKKKNSSQNCR